MDNSSDINILKRNEIINELMSLYKKDKEKCDQILDDLDYYDYIRWYNPTIKWYQIRKWFQMRKKGDVFETIPLCWVGPYSYQNSNTWVMIGEFIVENDILYAGIYNYHSVPPDYEYISTESIPDSVLACALQLITNGLSVDNVD